MRNVITFVEHKAGKTRKVTFELATEARRLADALGGKAQAVVLGEGASALAEQLKGYPLDLIGVSDDPEVDRFLEAFDAVLRDCGRKARRALGRAGPEYAARA